MELINKTSKNFLVIFIISFFYVGISYSQELNKDFINSLPENIKSEVLDNRSSQNDTDLKDYDSFTSDVNFEELENDSNKLTKFGSSFFQTISSSFMPINDPSATSDYILDVDDLLFIKFFGDKQDGFELKIDRTGSIVLDEIGQIVLAGLTLNDANKLLQSLVNENLVNTEIVITLKEVRDIVVLITGYVNNVGFYTLSGYSNFFHALHNAGGINDSGSYRNIQIKRNNKTIKVIDLYDYFIYGNLGSNISLQTGDVLLVPPSNNFVPVMGAVNNESIFEFKDGEALSDLLKFAGGLSSKSNLNKSFELIREDGAETKLVSDFYSNASNYLLKENDRVFIDYRQYQTDDLFISKNKDFIQIPVKVRGAVKYPGDYFIDQNQTLLELIEDFGGYKNDAYVFGAALYNKDAKEIEKAYNLRLYNDAIKSLANISSLSRIDSPSFIPSLLEEFKNINSLGRIVTEFDENKIKGDPTLNYNLSPGDEIFVPYSKDIVYVFGEVLNPGTLIFKKDLKVMDYIKKSGGLNDYADKSSIIIVQPNGESNKIQLRNFSGFKSEIFPGSVIYVPRNLKQIDGIELGSIVAPIVSSLAISLASINSISNN